VLDRDTFVLNNSILLFGRTNYGTHAPVATYPTELLTRHVLTRPDTPSCSKFQNEGAHTSKEIYIYIYIALTLRGAKPC